MSATQMPRVSPPWTCQWDNENETWQFINTETGERTHKHDYDAMNAGQAWRDSDQDTTSNHYADRYAIDAQQSLSNASQSIQDAPESAAYDVGAAVDRADEYKNEAEGANEGLGARVANFFSAGLNDIREDLNEGVEHVVDAPEKAMNGIGDGVGGVERFGEDVGEAVADVPCDAMQKAGEGVGDVRQAGEEVEQCGDALGNAYEQGREQERYD